MPMWNSCFFYKWSFWVLLYKSSKYYTFIITFFGIYVGFSGFLFVVQFFWQDRPLIFLTWIICYNSSPTNRGKKAATLRVHRTNQTRVGGGHLAKGEHPEKSNRWLTVILGKGMHWVVSCRASGLGERIERVLIKCENDTTLDSIANTWEDLNNI